MDVTDLMLQQTQTARTHNMDAEEIVGMFSALHHRAPSAFMDYQSSKIRVKKTQQNPVVRGEIDGRTATPVGEMVYLHQPKEKTGAQAQARGGGCRGVFERKD
jgi:hypothetical protein